MSSFRACWVVLVVGGVFVAAGCERGGTQSSAQLKQLSPELEQRYLAEASEAAGKTADVPAAAETKAAEVKTSVSKVEPAVVEKEAVDADGLAIATFGSGCFWCGEAVFEQLKGVESAESGYAGGHVENPTYYQIGSGTTGHAEVFQVRYDPKKISFVELLQVFWKTHDPTTLNRQGPDKGPQYRSVVFYHDETQRRLAEELKSELDASGVWPDPIVTEISGFTNFYAAEEEHQDFYERNRGNRYCRYYVVPKLEKLKKVFADKLKE